MKRQLIFGLLVLLLPWSTLANVKPADPASPLNNLNLVGEAELNVMFLSIYRSRLYSSDGDFIAMDGPLALEIEYLRNISAEMLINRTRKEWRYQGIYQQDPERAEQWLTQLAVLWPDIKKRDVLLMRLNPDGFSEFYFNKRSLGGIRDPLFGPSFMAIWLSPKTRFPELRQQLIGMAGNN